MDTYFAQYRFYNPDDKRFSAVDPVKGSVLNPQTMVQYTYCLDNSLKYSDPIGLAAQTSTSTGGGSTTGVRDYYEGQGYEVQWVSGSNGVGTINIKDKDGKTVSSMTEGKDFSINGGKAMMGTPTPPPNPKAAVEAAVKVVSDYLDSLSDEEIFEIVA